MLKAMLIISSLSGAGGDLKVPMPSMKECLETRKIIEKQDSNLSTICIPSVDDTDKVREFFSIFMDMFQEIKREEALDEFDRLEQRDERCKVCQTECSNSSSIRNSK